MNQLQKDIQTVITSLKDKTDNLNMTKSYEYERQAVARLEHYIHDDIQCYCRSEMKAKITEAMNTERTEIGKSVLRQLLESLE